MPNETTEKHIPIRTCKKGTEKPELTVDYCFCKGVECTKICVVQQDPVGKTYYYEKEYDVHMSDHCLVYFEINIKI